MSTQTLVPSEESAEITNSLVRATHKKIVRMSEDSRDLLYFHVTGESPEDACKLLRVPVSKEMFVRRLSGILHTISLPEALPEEEKLHILKLALDVFDKEAPPQA